MAARSYYFTQCCPDRLPPTTFPASALGDGVGRSTASLGDGVGRSTASLGDAASALATIDGWLQSAQTAATQAGQTDLASEIQRVRNAIRSGAAGAQAGYNLPSSFSLPNIPPLGWAAIAAGAYLLLFRRR